MSVDSVFEFTWQISVEAKKNRRADPAVLEIRCAVYLACALVSPTAERCENQKYAKKRAVRKSMERNVARPDMIRLSRPP